MSYNQINKGDFVSEFSSHSIDKTADEYDRRRSRREEDYNERRNRDRRGSPRYGNTRPLIPPKFEGEPGSTRWIESRVEYRKNVKFSIWPPSPLGPTSTSLSPLPKDTQKRRHKSGHERRHKHRRKYDDEQRRHERKHEKTSDTALSMHEYDNYDEDIGPAPLPEDLIKIRERDYGEDMLRGEGSAMAQYVQEGERIPRRGEIGLESNDIDKFEQAGYVMSGNRHKKMNEVRVRKENQVYSAEEKRTMLKQSAEERLKKENEIVASFRELISEKLSDSKEKK